ncbi:MAG: amylo-alpha-1,6-glucosidase [Bacteroidia bacterium]|nr:amylo-alpha-1,6-glucosidase [Bacteroidia bacterium]MDW8015341.1 amylo-alpha-1,6-glucosidase [Bacteroidia bacterium]
MERVGRVPLIEPIWALERELIQATEWGGFAATTLWGCPTRKYHSWFSLWKGFERYEFLPQMQEELYLQEGRFLLTSQYFHRKLTWEGYRHLHSFHVGPPWRWVYHIGDVSVEKTLYLSPTDPLWLLRYRFSGGALFRWIPLWSARPWHTLRREFFRVERLGERLIFPEGLTLYFYTEPLPRFIPWAYAYEGVFYPREEERGYEAIEILSASECWEWRLHTAGEVLIVLSSQPIASASLGLPERRYSHTTFFQALSEAADSFFLKDKTGEYIIAGHPWFSVWGRDTFISLPGLTLARGQTSRFHKVMETALQFLSPNGLFPNVFPNQYNSEDTGLWWIWALMQATRMGVSPKEIWERYGEALLQVLVGYMQRLCGENGLLFVEEVPPASWMDALVEGKPAVPRRGALVELNALWYMAVRFVAEIASQEGIRWRWGLLARKVLESFKPTFWNKARGYLADWRAEEEVSWQMRPNQLFAAALPYRPVSEKIAELILHEVEKHLLTPRGLRTLSPADPQYCGQYQGSPTERDKAYHNGTVWLWLMGSYIDARLSLWGEGARIPLLKLINGLEEALYAYGWGTLAEIYDGDAPHPPRGAPAQAWSVGEVLRAAFFLKAL